VQTESPEIIEQITALTGELQQATSKFDSMELQLNTASTEIALIKGTLDKEWLKAKQLWHESCNLQLNHEDEINSKDREIQALKVHLHRPLETSKHQWRN